MKSAIVRDDLIRALRRAFAPLPEPRRVREVAFRVALDRQLVGRSLCAMEVFEERGARVEGRAIIRIDDASLSSKLSIR